MYVYIYADDIVMNTSLYRNNMTEVGIAEYFSMAEALGIIATLFVILYFSRKQMQALSVDIETKILNDLDERMHANTFAHVYHMRQRGVVSDNEWTGWLRWMKSAFRHGTISEIWKNNVEVEKWFDPAFQEFINKELASSVAAKQ